MPIPFGRSTFIALLAATFAALGACSSHSDDGGTNTGAIGGLCPGAGDHVNGNGTVRSIAVDPSVTSYCPGNPYYKVLFDFDASATAGGAACHAVDQELRSIGGLHLTANCVTQTKLYVGEVLSLTLDQQFGHGEYNWYTPSPSTYDLCYHEGLACMTAAACDGGPCGGDASAD